MLSDADSGLALAATVCAGNNDSVLMGPVLQGFVERHGDLPDELAMDGGYDTPANAQALESCGVMGYVACSDRTFDPGLDEQRGIRCPHGRLLRYRKRFTKRGVRTHRLYVNCPECGGERTISGPEEADLSLWVEQRLRSRTQEAREAAVDRSSVSELLFAGMKQRHGLRRFLLRGPDGASIEVHMSLVLHNLQVLQRRLGTEGLRRLLGARLYALFRRIVRLRTEGGAIR